MTKKEIWDTINAAVAEWSKQGRTDEQVYGVKNFLTGLGKNAIEGALLRMNEPTSITTSSKNMKEERT